MKRQYLQQICDRLNERGFTAHYGNNIFSYEKKPYSLETKEIKDLEWLPEENLKKIAEYSGYATAKDFRGLYQAWGREGFFKFTPYIVDSKNTTLCVRHNKFLHMFRGYHYQLSGTPEGRIDCGSGLMRTDGFIKLLHDEDYVQSHLGFIVLYAAMIDCGFQNDNFRELFYSDKDAVDDYFRKSLEYWGVKFTYGNDVVGKYISYRDDSIKAEESEFPVYCFRDARGVYCRFWLSSKAVEVEYCSYADKSKGGSGVIRFDIPDPIKGIDIESIKWWTDDDTEDLRIAFDEACYGDEKIEYFVLLMLLKLVGVHTNYMVTYPIRKVGYIAEDTKAITLDKFDELMK